MTFTRQQLEQIVSHELAGARLREAREMTPGRFTLLLSDGERLTLQTYASNAEASATATALRLLQGELDAVLPQLRAADQAGALLGVPYTLSSEVQGKPLAQVLARVGEAQLYEIGVRLGQAIYRVHRLLCERYGELGGDPDATTDERGYTLARLQRDTRTATELGLLDIETCQRLYTWFEESFHPPGRQPALIHGDLSPETLLVQQADGVWKLSALIGWEYATGWAPAWEHTTLFDATYQPQYFALRVGYGNGYDEQALRTYEQVREFALAPYRALLALRNMALARSYGDQAASDRYRTMVLTALTLLASVEDEEEE